MFVQLLPGADEFFSEKYAAELEAVLAEWSRELKAGGSSSILGKHFGSRVEAISFSPVRDSVVRSLYEMEVRRRQFGSAQDVKAEAVIRNFDLFFKAFNQIEVAEFHLLSLHESSPSQFETRIRYEIAGQQAQGACEQRIGHWRMQWSRAGEGQWRILKWEAEEESAARVRAPLFADITDKALGANDSYKHQLLHGNDYWRTVLDGACGIDVYGNNGIAVGDFDGDGFDDLYICQPAGLPNRLYRNRGDGTFEDATESSGLGVLDNTSCALFADFENKGVQDLLVVCGSGPLLLLNDGKGKYSLKPDAFKFQRPPEGTFTHAALADYDHDGRLEIYFCLYNYYLGLDQYHYPAPYFDARNGPPNFLMHNEGNGTFIDRTDAAGLNVENDRYSFACAWGDMNGNGWPDLYVANDFGRSNLYRNNGDGTFTAISSDAHANDAGAGMSACWFDYDNDGKQDIYVANMWSAAGMRISEEQVFHQNDSEEVRADYRRHARGNSLYRNVGTNKFENAAATANAAVGRWAWSSDAWDFDHDGYSDLYIANGYISGFDAQDASSFFWRHVVARSPASATPSSPYELGWNAINELIRSDRSWNGPERNVFYLNNRDGSFSDISAAAGLDFADDARSFALLDLDHDGRPEVVIKNRNAPQVRVLRNVMTELGHSISFRLRGTKSNRDAVGAAVTIEAPHRQTKYVQAGSGFLSQHTKELFFGLGDSSAPIRAVVHWPSGLTQTFADLPINSRIEIEEGSDRFAAKPFAAQARFGPEAARDNSDPLPDSVETWLIQPLKAPDFGLPDLNGKSWQLASLRGSWVLLHFWTKSSSACSKHLQLLEQHRADLSSVGLKVASVNVDDAQDQSSIKTFAATTGLLSFPILLASPEIAGIYNVTFRYLFDRHRDLPIPSAFLVDPAGMIVKVFQGDVNPDQLVRDIRSTSPGDESRITKALPFPGTLHLGTFGRNDFTYGVALFQRGYLDEAVESFKQVIAAKPQEPEAYYNLGTLYLRKNDFDQARQYLEQTVKLRPTHAEAWNNLGMLAAQTGQTEEGVRDFQQSLSIKPNYATALLNLGNLYRRARNFSEAEDLLGRALEAEPDNPEANYNLGMVYAQQNQFPKASEYFERALALRPDYPDALNNLGVLLVRQGHYAEAQEKFASCIRVAPNLDQGYLNLARLYAVMNDKEKARSVLQDLLQRQPENKIAQQSLEMLK
ncbi:MAG TPA: tetratricopeptide repeat protein [Terriglobales bacterium]|nr:tetratricopeptide repeat protein [Terriglobales bacterium]